MAPSSDAFPFSGHLSASITHRWKTGTGLGHFARFIGLTFLALSPATGQPLKIIDSRTSPNPGGGSDISLTWNSEAGARYQVERANLDGTPWTFAGEERTGSGGAMTFRESISASRMFYRVTEIATAPKVRRVATVGDSITAASCLPFGTGTNYWTGGWGAHLRTLVNHRIVFEKSPHSGVYTFAVSSAHTHQYQVGGDLRDRWEAAMASGADTIMVMLGANDLVEPDASVDLTSAHIIRLWDEAIGSGKQVIGLEILPLRADHPSAGIFPPRQTACNEILRIAAAERGMLFIRCASVLDEDRDGFAEGKYMEDTVHPGILGGMKLSKEIASWLEARLNENPVPLIPPPGDPAWLMTTAFPSGTPGPNRQASGWTIQPAGGASFVPRLVERTDGIPGHWQELEISGMTDAGCLKPAPTDFIQLYTSNFAPALVPGDRLRMVAEIEMDQPFWNVWAEMHISGMRSGDHHHNGAMGGLSEKPDAYKGMLLTEPWEYTGGNVSLAMLKICGNGRIRIGRLGIFKVP